MTYKHQEASFAKQATKRRLSQNRFWASSYYTLPISDIKGRRHPAGPIVVPCCAPFGKMLGAAILVDGADTGDGAELSRALSRGLGLRRGEVERIGHIRYPARLLVLKRGALVRRFAVQWKYREVGLQVWAAPLLPSEAPKVQEGYEMEEVHDIIKAPKGTVVDLGSTPNNKYIQKTILRPK